MKYKTFDILIVCNYYSNYLNASLFYWNNVLYNKELYRIIIISSNKDYETARVVYNYINNGFFNICLIPYSGNDYNNKGLMINYCYNIIKKIGLNQFLFLTDADIIFPPDILLKTSCNFIESEKLLISSYREDISKDDIDLFFKLYNNNENNKYWVWENIKREVLYPSPFMGWFLTFKSDYLNKIDTIKLDSIKSHVGYDVIDYKIYGQLKSLGLYEKIIYFDNVPLHIYHGKKGENWKGIKYID